MTNVLTPILDGIHEYKAIAEKENLKFEITFSKTFYEALFIEAKACGLDISLTSKEKEYTTCCVLGVVIRKAPEYEFDLEQEMVSFSGRSFFDNFKD